jgi:hypothetical protein
MTRNRRATVIVSALVIVAVLATVKSPASATPTLKSPYTYHVTGYSTGDYSGLVTDMQTLNTTYPHICEIFTAQDAFGLPDVVAGSERYKILIMRITNESTGFDKPEVLFIGGHHGDEKASIEAAYYTAEWLLTNYDADAWIRYLVDHREVYIMPVVNPYGWVHHQRYDENGYDMNRDYPYDASSHIFATIGARAVHELTKRHLFINTVSWHGGTEMIIYAWGSYAHNYNTESPDDVAFYRQGYYMQQYSGPYSGYYPFGRSNDILYPCYGAYEDYAYAASWDTVHTDPSWPTSGCRSLTHCVEMSSSKFPSESTLGDRSAVYAPGGAGDGYIPKNIRIALLMTDIAEPYLSLSCNATRAIEPGTNVTFAWDVMGALSTTETILQYGLDPDPVHNYTHTTSLQSGGTGWDDVTFSESVALPQQPGTYYFVARAAVDHDMLTQTNPDPDIGPQSLYVNMRTDDAWNVSNNGNTLQGREHWYSQVVALDVYPSEISQDYDLRAGWNLITLPVESNHTAKSLLASITGCTIVYGYDAANATAHIVTAGSPPETDFPVENGVGYFVAVSANTSFSITGVPLENPTVHLYPGWNLLGWYREQNTTAKSILGNITDCAIVYYYDATTGTPTIVTPSSPPETDFPVSRGMGLFVAVTSESDWHGEG